MAPEIIFRQNHSFEVDYFALGVIIYELVIGKVWICLKETIFRENSLGNERKFFTKVSLNETIVTLLSRNGWFCKLANSSESIQKARKTWNFVTKKSPVVQRFWMDPTGGNEYNWTICTELRLK